MLTHDIEEFTQPVGDPGRNRRDGALRHRGAEQLGQRLGSVLLRQELPDIQLEDDRGDPRSVLHRCRYPLWGHTTGGHTVAAPMHTS